MKARLAMWIVMILGGIALGLYLDWLWFWNWFMEPLFHFATLVVGAFLLRFVLLTSRHTGRLLARLGREGDDVPRMDTNKLVKTGFYAHMRHPMHLGLLFFPLSIALIIGSPSFIFIIAPLEMLLMVILIKLVEEPEAIRKFGDDYRQYMKEVPMFNFRPAVLRSLMNDDPATLPDKSD